MPLSRIEIRRRATAFAKEWADTSDEDAEAKSFWDGFFEVFGVPRKRVATFEHHVKKLDKADGFIDLLWPGKLVVEHKSRGKNLDKAYGQAMDYLHGLKDHELPRYIVASDFARIRVHDLENKEDVTIALADLPKRTEAFDFISGWSAPKPLEQDPVNRKAAELMARLHDELKASGYTGHALEHYLVRLLFCLFADDTGIFEQQVFYDFIEGNTKEDGSDVGQQIAWLFQLLNTPDAQRSKALDDRWKDFHYINGKLFAEQLPIATWDGSMRITLLECAALDWTNISPAIFGAMFQGVMDPKQRRDLGAHYTSEQNILKLIKPLFLDELWEEFNRTKSNKTQLDKFHQKLAGLRFLDPACGCGNFLVITYRELRRLELEVLKVKVGKQQVTDVEHLVNLNVDRFYGIEIEEFPAQIAQVAMWLADHQMNMEVSAAFGEYMVRIPLRHSATIANENALRLPWQSLLKEGERYDYILGNPPFVGSKMMSADMRADLEGAMVGWPNAGTLDFVCAWYGLAARYIKAHGSGHTRCAFVSTNSICQGEQVSALWSPLLAQGIKIHFAHRTFRWNNEARGIAAVHCVIVGFGDTDVPRKRIFSYTDARGEAYEEVASNINPYLVDGRDVLIPSRSKTLCNVPEIGIGNKPIDGGNYLFTTEERDVFIQLEPASQRYFKRWLGSDEFLNGWERWCLWLGDCSPEELRRMPLVMKRVQAVRQVRLESKSAPTQKLADTPTRFHVENMPHSTYLIIPEVSSERRRFIPIGYEEPSTLASNLVKIVPNASRYHFGILSSTMHNAWMRSVAGRLKSDYRYSKDIVYNNFPWPESPTEAQRAAVEQAAQGVLDARAAHPGASLADLYDPLTMPANLVKAHVALDSAVDKCYRKAPFTSEPQRVAYLFELYEKYTMGLLGVEKAKRKQKK
ncbi:MAG: DNA methyltransferase [Flavobacteriales bacterium]